MAAQTACHTNRVVLCDAMPSVGRKLLMAGRGGLNLSHSEPAAQFLSRFRPAAALQPFLNRFGPAQVVEWCRELGIDTFVGSSGRIFPTDFKAAPLVRAWVRHLRQRSVEFRVRHRWTGWDAHGQPRFDTPDGPVTIAADATILALGGASWPHLGSDGHWLPLLQARGIACAPFRPANCGFDTDWSPYLRDRFAGTPLKSVVLSFQGQSVKGDITITANGMEGGPIYRLSADLRDHLEVHDTATISLDLCPDRSTERLSADLAIPRGSRSLSNHLKRVTNLPPLALALLHESCHGSLPVQPRALASLIKALPLPLLRPRPLAEAISSAGGICWDEVNPNSLEINKIPGLFVAGEMLDWEAPTGGYLLTGCLALGAAAGQAAGITH